MNTIYELASRSKDDFAVAAKLLGRTPNSCVIHWKGRILPILKNDELGLPQGIGWRKKFLLYAIENKIQNIKHLKYGQLAQEHFPGQTSTSLNLFANNIVKRWQTDIKSSSQLQFYEMCDEFLHRNSDNSALDNEKCTEASYAEDIIQIYKDNKIKLKIHKVD